MQYKEPELPGIPPAPKTFRSELRELINKYSLENDSNTPDFVLARYLMDCFKAASRMVADREDWYGRPIRVYTEYDPAKHTTRAMVEEIPDLYAEEARTLTVECLSCGTEYEAGTEHQCSTDAKEMDKLQKEKANAARTQTVKCAYCGTECEAGTTHYCSMVNEQK